MVVRTLDAKRDPFRPNEDEEEILEPEVPYLSVIGALLYLAQCTRPDISFVVNLLARYINAPTRRHWNGVKDIFHYLKGITDLSLFYTYESPSNAAPYSSRIDSRLVGYADARYLSNPHRSHSQTGYVFTVGDTTISWRSTKQTLVVTLFNLAEILTLHEASHNAACIEQLKKGYIKGDNTKHIAPKFFYLHQHQQHQNIEVKKIRSQDNLADLFTKSLPKSTFQKLIQEIGMRKLSELNRL
ncbi:secreted RxLR effector protein 161-like [Malus domestica]|uniref:secreted RxLR effector protein 161-like n=1 Tax=Malus domestica TaxID=3750 RepID=UPI0039765B42